MKYWPERPLKKAAIVVASAALATALLLAQGGEPQNTSKTPPAVSSNDAAFRRVSNRLLCQCGCSYMVLSCNHVDCSSATFIRRTIQTKLAAGQSEDAIVAGFIDQYGPRILPEPPRKGFSLSAWVMPFAVLILGGAFLSYFLWHWKFRSQLAQAGVGSENPEEGRLAPKEVPLELVEKYRAQIDRDLENE
jgi:cytochrome c-type biogenesis protein CcmH/NrfF